MVITHVKLTVDAHHIQQIRPNLPDGVEERVHPMDEPLCCFGEKLKTKKTQREKLRLCKIWSLVYMEIDCSNTRKTNNEQEMLLMSVLIQFRAPQNMNISWFKFNTYIVKNNTTAFIISDPVWMQPVKQTKTRGFYMNRENPLRR